MKLDEKRGSFLKFFSHSKALILKDKISVSWQVCYIPSMVCKMKGIYNNTTNWLAYLTNICCLVSMNLVGHMFPSSLMKKSAVLGLNSELRNHFVRSDVPHLWKPTSTTRGAQ